jgi:hypothetical protein
MFFAFGWTKSRRSDWNKESISPPSRGSGSHAGIRGDLSGDSVFFLDNANPKPDGPDAGSFYNKAPRFSVFQGDSYQCDAIK